MPEAGKNHSPRLAGIFFTLSALNSLKNHHQALLPALFSNNYTLQLYFGLNNTTSPAFASGMVLPVMPVCKQH